MFDVKQMIRIGEFSRISRVSIKALRLYDRIGLLKPIKTDKFSRYRYYSADQLEDLNRIVVLKNLGLSLKQIIDFSSGHMSADTIKRLLSVREAEIHERLLVEKKRLGQVEEWLRIIEKDGAILLSLKTSEVLNDLEEALITCNAAASVESARRAIELGIDIQRVFEVINEAMKEVCNAFEKGSYWIPDLLGAAEAMLCTLPILKDAAKGRRANPHFLGKIVVGTVFGDIHSIGKDMVSALQIANGFEIYDLGVDVKAEDFVEAVKRYKPCILAMSALLTTTAPEQKAVINALKEEGIRDRVKVMVGGGAINAAFARDIGADGYDPTAPGAVRLAKKLVGILEINQYERTQT